MVANFCLFLHIPWTNTYILSWGFTVLLTRNIFFLWFLLAAKIWAIFWPLKPNNGRFIWCFHKSPRQNVDKYMRNQCARAQLCILSGSWALGILVEVTRTENTKQRKQGTKEDNVWGIKVHFWCFFIPFSSTNSSLIMLCRADLFGLMMV